MNGVNNPTHLERLLRWCDGDVVPPGELGYSEFKSALLPTRRFGPAGWVSFLMGVSPKSATTGEFVAWVLYDAKSLRLAGYLARPLADTFGIVNPFELPGSPFDPAVAPALGALGDAFFAGQPRPPATEGVDALLAGLGEGYLAALREATPDFFQWMEHRA